MVVVDVYVFVVFYFVELILLFFLVDIDYSNYKDRSK